LGFDNLREKLLLGGIAPRHVRRYLAELHEHLDDLIREQRKAGYDGEDAALRARARLGSDDELAAAMLEQKQFRSIASRAPWAVFLFLPPVAAVAIGILFIDSLVLIGKYFGYLGMPASLPPQWFQMLAHGLVALSNLTTMPLAAIIFAVVAQRQRLKLIWPLLATLLLLVLFFHNDVLFALHGKGHLMLGAGPIFSRHGWMMLTENWQWAVVQYALTLLPVLWLYRRRMAAAA
jgi:hypothetical protein